MEFYFLIKRYSFFLGILILLFSCQKEITLELPRYQEQLVVDGRIETGLPPIIFLGTTKDIFSDNSLDSIFGSYISDALITITDGIETDTLQTLCSDEIPKGYENLGALFFGIPANYITKYHFCAYSTLNTKFFGVSGKSYSIKINYKGNTYTSTTTIPNPVELDTVFWKEEKNYPGYGLAYAKFSDPIETGNGYLWEVLRLKVGSDGTNMDKKFYKPRHPVFNDQFINGQTIQFWYENPRTVYDETIDENYRGYYPKGDTVIIKFSSISPKVFEFHQKKYVQIYNGGSPFSSPIKVPTNIVGGAIGLWGGYSTSYKTLICSDSTN